MLPAIESVASIAERFVNDAAPVSPAVVTLGQGELTGTAIGDLEKLIGTDPEFSLRVLALANSAFYSQQYEITELRGALVVLGAATVQSLAAGLILRSLAADRSPAVAAIWHHSLAVGVAAEQVAEAHRRVAEKEAYIAALLHDVGFLVTLRTGSDDLDSQGLSHAELGAEVASLLGLSPTLCAAIRHHHDVPVSGSPLAATIRVAEVVAERAGYGLELEDDVDSSADAALESLDLLPDDLDAFVECLPSRIAALSNVLQQVD